jgi:hypothetical protein
MISGMNIRRGLSWIPVPRIRQAVRHRPITSALLALVLLLLLSALGGAAALRINYTGEPREDARTRGRDAVWLGHAWVDGRKQPSDVTALARKLRGTGIRDLYVHTGPLEFDGDLAPSKSWRAGWFITAIKRQLPGIRVQSWLGQTLDTEVSTGLDLADRDTRRRIADSARQVLDAGFDGVHLDLEPAHSEDPDFLRLLDALHTVTANRHAPLSVAAHQIDPVPWLHSVAGTLTGHPKWWSQRYFGQVARRVDQIAVMSYDTALPWEGLYGGYVAQQTALALEVTPRSTDLLIGLPGYHTEEFGHHEHAETVRAAVRGARLGLTREAPDRRRFGTALYVDFAATDADWRAYREGWGKR